MVTTTNQTIDLFRSQIGRDPTPYEIEKYSKASSQQLASLKDIYEKLDTNSLLGYVTSKGLDFSIGNLQKLAQQYGVPNFGTPKGNEDLLNAIKTNTPYPNQPMTGSITPNYSAFGSDQNATYPTENYPVKGSITEASQTTNTNHPPKVEGIDGALSTYQNIQKQIADIDNAIASALRNKKAEASAGGGRIDESSIRAQVYNESAPLLSQRRELATQQAQAGKMYTDLLARQKESDANFYKSQAAELASHKQETQESQFATTTGIKEKQLADAEAKQAQAQKNFEATLAQKGIKYNKFVDQDTGGTVYQEVINGVAGSYYKLDDNGVPVEITGGQTTPTTSTVQTNPINIYGIKTSNTTLGFGGTDSGVKSSDGGTFLSAGTPEEDRAIAKQLLTSSIYSNLTLDQAMKKWSNNGYGGEIATPLKGNVKIKDLSDSEIDRVLSGIQKQEGISSKTPPITDMKKGIFQGFNTTDESVPTGSLLTTPIQELDKRTPAAIIQNSAAYALQGGNLQQFVGGLSAKDPKTQRIKNAIDNKASALAYAAGTDLPTLRKDYKADTKLAGELAPRYAFTSAAANTADVNIDLAIKESPKVNRTDSAFINNIILKYQKDFTKATELSKFEVYIYTIAREYGKVVSGSASSIAGLTDTQTKASELLLAARQSPEAFAAATEAMKNDMKNVQDKLLDQIGAQSSFKSIRDFMALIHPQTGERTQQGGSSYQDYLKTIGQ